QVSIYFPLNRSDDRRRDRQLRDARRFQRRGTRRVDRLRRPARDRADDSPETAQGIPTLRIPARTRHARRSCGPPRTARLPDQHSDFYRTRSVRLRIADCGLRICRPQSTIYNWAGRNQAKISKNMFSIRNYSQSRAAIRNMGLLIIAMLMLACADSASSSKNSVESAPAPVAGAEKSGNDDKTKTTTAFDGERAFNHVKAQ